MTICHKFFSLLKVEPLNRLDDNKRKKLEKILNEITILANNYIISQGIMREELIYTIQKSKQMRHSLNYDRDEMERSLSEFSPEIFKKTIKDIYDNIPDELMYGSTVKHIIEDVVFALNALRSNMMRKIGTSIFKYETYGDISIYEGVDIDLR